MAPKKKRAHTWHFRIGRSVSVRFVGNLQLMIQKYLLKASVNRFQELVWSSKHLLQSVSAVGGTWVIRQLLKRANIATNISTSIATNIATNIAGKDETEEKDGTWQMLCYLKAVE